MNKYHKEIVELFSSYSGTFISKHGSGYVGTSKFSYPMNVPTSRTLLKDWLKKTDLTPDEYTDLLNSLSQGKSHNEFGAIGKLLEFCPKLRKTLSSELLGSWLDRAEGWAEVDGICQSNFSAEELLSNWSVWKQMIERFSTSKNVHKRRASLVLLTGAVRRSSDQRLSALSFKNIEKLKNEKDILITKAISWLLRDLISYHREEVKRYLKNNSDSLPKIAVRETTNKLKTGRK